MPRWSVLASDVDGTLATSGRIPQEAYDALAAFRSAGGTVVVITGRRLPELREVFPGLVEAVDLVVAENGALLVVDGEESLLGPAIPDGLPAALAEAGCRAIDPGRAIVSFDSEQAAAGAAVLDPDWQLILNKDRAMVLPVGVDKGSGLRAGLAHLGVAPEQVVAVGDGENDAVLLQAVGLGVAVAGAVPELKAVADHVTAADASAGVVELVEALLSDALVPAQS